MSESRVLDRYRLLGRSGLRVSPLALGTMTFGTDWGWGCDEAEALRMFEGYIEQGGNFIDTANLYTNGTSEELVGKFAQGRRNRLIIATKYTFTTDPDDVNSGGNHRKSMLHSVERSLKRLKTDFIDLLYLHAWDATTPVDEILRAMDDLVRVGKVLYIGVSNTMAWQVSRMQAVAELRGWTPLVALQIPYSLLERTAEHELIPMAREMGLGTIAWAPLAGGLLTGKYMTRDRGWSPPKSVSNSLRKDLVVEDGGLSERNLRVMNVVMNVAAETEKSPAQVSLAWLLSRSGLVSLLVGARTLNQLNENIRVMEVELTRSQCDQLDEISQIEPGFPHAYLAKLMASQYMSGAMKIAKAT